MGYEGEADPGSGEFTGVRVVGDVEWDCFDDGFCCDPEFNSCETIDQTGTCEAVDMISFQIGECVAKEGEAADDTGIPTGPCPANVGYRILVSWLNYAIGHFGLVRLIWGLPNWWVKLILTMSGVLVAAPLMILGLLTGNIINIAIGVILIIAGEAWNIIDSFIWLFGTGFYRKSVPDKCSVKDTSKSCGLCSIMRSHQTPVPDTCKSSLDLSSRF